MGIVEEVSFTSWAENEKVRLQSNALPLSYRRILLASNPDRTNDHSKFTLLISDEIIKYIKHVIARFITRAVLFFQNNPQQSFQKNEDFFWWWLIESIIHS